MSLFDYSALDKAPLQHDPFDFLVAPGFLPDEVLKRVNRDYPEIDTPANLDPAKLRYGPAFQELLNELESPRFAAEIGRKFGVGLDNAVSTITVRKYAEASDGNIHTDHWSKIITVLIYFNEDWQHDTGNLRMLRSPNDIEDYAAEVAPIGGSLLAFRRSAKSWHGHKRFVGERRMLQMNWVSGNPLARTVQRLDRFSTHLMKRLSRVAS
jgi:SM-20-related protein